MISFLYHQGLKCQFSFVLAACASFRIDDRFMSDAHQNLYAIPLLREQLFPKNRKERSKRKSRRNVDGQNILFTRALLAAIFVRRAIINTGVEEGDRNCMHYEKCVRA